MPVGFLLPPNFDALGNDVAGRFCTDASSSHASSFLLDR